MVSKVEDANKQLERVSKMALLGEMSAMVAHEVLNPLTSIFGRVQGMIKHKDVCDSASAFSVMQQIITDWNLRMTDAVWAKYRNAVNKDAIDTFQQDMSDLNVLVNHVAEQDTVFHKDLVFLENTILHVVKIIENMKMLARPQRNMIPLDINEILDETVELESKALEKRKVAVRKNYARHLPLIHADSGELIQVFTNVVRNAEQAIGKNGEITLQTLQNGARVEIHVTDTGPGISAELAHPDLIFESGVTTKSDGTGLGLGICRRFVRSYGGDITIESTIVGVGTTFLIWLPCHESQARSMGNDCRDVE
jgi:signal transduction histidine kinase